jgi:hypothetical protein
MTRFVRKRLAAMSRAVALAWLWSNRRDVGRWARFARRSVSSPRPNRRDLVTEARVRAAISADPLLRRDSSLKDLLVREGVVRVQTDAMWRNRSIAVQRIEQVPGVSAVHTATDISDAHWLDLDRDEFGLRDLSLST